jgi:uncharacterized protein (DUF1697 family)
LTEQGWVALLRGINIGARNRVPMAGLRTLFEELGLGDVRTVIASGNVLFTGAKPDGEALERAIGERFGVRAPVVLRTFDEIRAVAAGHPFGDDGSKSYVTFLAAKPKPAAVRALAAAEIAPHEAVVAGRDVYLRLPNGITGAHLPGQLLERLLGVPGTARNWRTVTKLAELSRT